MTYLSRPELHGTLSVIDRGSLIGFLFGAALVFSFPLPAVQSSRKKTYHRGPPQLGPTSGKSNRV
jgi:hypothetical protein